MYMYSNENVGRASTSERVVQDRRRQDWRTPMKVLVKKTFNFVDDIWKTYVEQKLGDLRLESQCLTFGRVLLVLFT